ncbi:MAG: hypothetical protein ACRDHN_19625 [Thermomicrobiales bacterium]
MADLAPTTDSVASVDRVTHRGPLIFAAILSIIGVVYVLVGSVTVVPFISDERRREPIRKMWAALSRDLPDIGHPGPEKVGFWIVVALTAILSIALMLLAATVTDVSDSEADSVA